MDRGDEVEANALQTLLQTSTGHGESNRQKKKKVED